MRRAALWGLGIVLLLASAVCGLLALFGLSAADAPDVVVDPSDGWAEVLLRCALAICAAAITGLVLAGGCLLIAWAANSRPRRSLLKVLPVAFAAVWTVALAVMLVPERDQAVAFPDCRTWEFDGPAWRTESVEHRRQAAGLQHCGTLRGLTTQQLRAKLGTPVAPYDDIWVYRELEIYIGDDGRVIRARSDDEAGVADPYAVD